MDQLCDVMIIRDTGQSTIHTSVVHVIFPYFEAERTEAILNKNKHCRGEDGGGIRNIDMVEADDEAKGKNIELLEGEADNNKDKVDDENIIHFHNYILVRLAT